MCAHEETIISPENECVCLSCGMVLEQVYHCMLANNQIDECENDDVKNFLLDMCSDIHIPTGIIQSVLDRYKKLSENVLLSKFSNVLKV